MAGSLPREIGKRVIGYGALGLMPSLRMKNAVFIIGHMRSGSTALSNIIINHNTIEGFGEAHVYYQKIWGLGLLKYKTYKNSLHKKNSRYIFDKILHSKYHENSCANFYDSRAIFLIREPSASIASIVRMQKALGESENDNFVTASSYYKERILMLKKTWSLFSEENRFFVTHDDIINRPDEILSELSTFLKLAPPLENYYPANKALKKGVGDPFNANRLRQITSIGNSGDRPKFDGLAGLQNDYEEAVAWFRAS